MGNIDSNGTYRYGNDIIGYHSTRHKAVGAAAIHARKDPFPFGEELEWRRPDRRRRDILRRCGFVYARKEDTDTSHGDEDE